MILSFVIFLLGFTVIGLSSAFKSRGTKSDYYVASSSVSPWLVGLSAVATNNSGYMFIGVIGYTYVAGLSSIWLMVGWIVGDYLSSVFVHHRLLKVTNQSSEVSYAGVLSSWYGSPYAKLQKLIAAISLLFLFTYAAAQLVAGGKALHVLFELPVWVGSCIGAVLVCLYCFAGGIRASIWTDAAQSIVMIFAMALLLVTAIVALGGTTNVVSQMQEIEHFLTLQSDPDSTGWGATLIFFVGWLFAGFSVVGQPHIMVRFMTLNDATKMNKARLWYYLWFTAFYLLATGVGMVSRLYLPELGAGNAELALPLMAQGLLPPILVGIVLAGIFAATMSTADSLILSCSAAVTHDLLPKKIENTLVIKAVTVLITVVALGIALSNNQSVFNLVILSWSGLASAFAPLLVVLCLGWKPSEKTCISAVVLGFVVALLWRAFGLQAYVYEGLPGIVFGLFVFSVARYRDSQLSSR